MEYDGRIVLALRSFLNDEWFCRNAAEVAVDYGRIAWKNITGDG